MSQSQSKNLDTHRTVSSPPQNSSKINRSVSSLSMKPDGTFTDCSLANAPQNVEVHLRQENDSFFFQTSGFKMEIMTSQLALPTSEKTVKIENSIDSRAEKQNHTSRAKNEQLKICRERDENELNQIFKNENHTEKLAVVDIPKKREIFLKNINKHIICNLCQGYLIDATTIVECLHSFCHSCIIKHLRSEQYCPRCEVMVNTAKPNLKPDATLQAIVYKIVPSLYEKELMRRRTFYRNRPTDAAITTPEQRGEDTEHLIFNPNENISLSLEYAYIENYKTSDSIRVIKKPRYLQCPASFTVAHLKKFIFTKFGINPILFVVEIMYKVKTIVLYDHCTLMDIAYIYTWKRDAPMRFFFGIKQKEELATKMKKFSHRNIVKNDRKLINYFSNSFDDVEKNSIRKKHTKDDINLKFEHFNDLENMYKSRFGIMEEMNSKNEQESQKNEKEKSFPTNESYSQPEDNSVASNEVDSCSLNVNAKQENIKMKIDISKHDSIKIINMSGPTNMPKEIVKLVKFEKERKTKLKKSDKIFDVVEDKMEQSKNVNLVSDSISRFSLDDNKSDNGEKITASPATEKDEDEKKSEFLNSFALTSIKNICPQKRSKANMPALKALPPKIVMGPPSESIPALKRKLKEPMNTTDKVCKFEFVDMITTENFPKQETEKPTNTKEIIKFDLVRFPVEESPSSSSMKDLEFLKKRNSQKKWGTNFRKISKHSQKANVISGFSNSFHTVASASPPLIPAGIASSKSALVVSSNPISKKYSSILPKQFCSTSFPCIQNKIKQHFPDLKTKFNKINENSKNLLKVYSSSTNILVPSKTKKVCDLQNEVAITKNPFIDIKISKNSKYLNYSLYNSNNFRINDSLPECHTPTYASCSSIYPPRSHFVPDILPPTKLTYKYIPNPANMSFAKNISSKKITDLLPIKSTKSVENSSEQNQIALSEAEIDLENSILMKNVTIGDTQKDVDGKQIKFKTLLNSCNINIPSSLSITITNENNDSKSNNKQSLKHNAPVKNYIEILKLPEQSLLSKSNIGKKAKKEYSNPDVPIKAEDMQTKKTQPSDSEAYLTGSDNLNAENATESLSTKDLLGSKSSTGVSDIEQIINIPKQQKNLQNLMVGISDSQKNEPHSTSLVKDDSYLNRQKSSTSIDLSSAKNELKQQLSAIRKSRYISPKTSNLFRKPNRSVQQPKYILPKLYENNNFSTSSQLESKDAKSDIANRNKLNKKKKRRMSSVKLNLNPTIPTQNNSKTVSTNFPNTFENKIQISKDVTNFVKDTFLKATVSDNNNSFAVNNASNGVYLPNLAVASYEQFSPINFKYSIQQAMALERYARCKAEQNTIDNLINDTQSRSTCKKGSSAELKSNIVPTNDSEGSENDAVAVP